MELLNRIALVVRPKRRYAEWAVSVTAADDEVEFDLDEARLSPSVYLVAARDDEHLEDLIDDYAGEIFEAELEAWHIDEAGWPINRSPHVFRDWFDVTLGPLVHDLDPDQPLDIDVDLDGAEIDRQDLLEALGGDPDAELTCGWCETPIDRRGEIATVVLKGPRESREVAEAIELPIAGRTVPAVLPPDESPAAADGVTAIVVCCGDECCRAFRDAWNREHAGH
jgi:hypothetical protein